MTKSSERDARDLVRVAQGLRHGADQLDAAAKRLRLAATAFWRGDTSEARELLREAEDTLGFSLVTSGERDLLDILLNQHRQEIKL